MSDWTPHTLQLAELNEFLQAILPPTDSRLRGDRYALYQGDAKKASQEKHFLEEKQRDDKKLRESNSRQWNPRFFKLAKDDDGDDFWQFTGNYWDERDKRIQKYLDRAK